MAHTNLETGRCFILITLGISHIKVARVNKSNITQTRLMINLFYSISELDQLINVKTVAVVMFWVRAIGDLPIYNFSQFNGAIAPLPWFGFYFTELCGVHASTGKPLHDSLEF